MAGITAGDLGLSTQAAGGTSVVPSSNGNGITASDLFKTSTPLSAPKVAGPSAAPNVTPVSSPSASLSKGGADFGSIFGNAVKGVENAAGAVGGAIDKTVGAVQNSQFGKSVQNAVTGAYDTVVKGLSGPVKVITNAPILPGNLSLNQEGQFYGNLIDQVGKIAKQGQTQAQNWEAQPQNAKVTQALADVQKTVDTVIGPYAKGFTEQYMGWNKPVMDVFNKAVPKTDNKLLSTYNTIGELAGNVVGFLAGGEILKGLELGKATMPILFAAFGQTSAPSTTTALQRIEKLPIDAVAGFLFSMVPAAKNLLSGEALQKAGLGAGIMSGQSYLDSLVQGMSPHDARTVAEKTALMAAAFHVAGTATGLITNQLLDSKYVGGQIEMSPSELRNQVMNTDLKGTEAGDGLVKLSIQAEEQGKNVLITAGAAKRGPLAEAFNMKTPQGVMFQGELVDASPQISGGQAATGEQPGRTITTTPNAPEGEQPATAPGQAPALATQPVSEPNQPNAQIVQNPPTIEGGNKLEPVPQSTIDPQGTENPVPSNEIAVTTQTDIMQSTLSPQVKAIADAIGKAPDAQITKMIDALPPHEYPYIPAKESPTGKALIGLDALKVKLAAEDKMITPQSGIKATEGLGGGIAGPQRGEITKLETRLNELTGYTPTKTDNWKQEYHIRNAHIDGVLENAPKDVADEIRSIQSKLSVLRGGTDLSNIETMIVKPDHGMNTIVQRIKEFYTDPKRDFGNDRPGEAFNSLIEAKDFSEFTKQIEVLSKKYGIEYKSIYDMIKSGEITQETYDNFKHNYTQSLEDRIKDQVTSSQPERSASGQALQDGANSKASGLNKGNEDTSGAVKPETGVTINRPAEPSKPERNGNQPGRNGELEQRTQPADRTGGSGRGIEEKKLSDMSESEQNDFLKGKTFQYKDRMFSMRGGFDEVNEEIKITKVEKGYVHYEGVKGGSYGSIGIGSFERDVLNQSSVNLADVAKKNLASIVANPKEKTNGIKKPLSPKNPYHNDLETAIKMLSEKKKANYERGLVTADKILADPKSYTKANLRWAENYKSFWTGPSIKDPKMTRLEELTELTPNRKAEFTNDYIKGVKDAISHGYDIPQSIIKQFPEFTKAINARERYEKGLHTSFANKSSAVNEVTKSDYGFKVKRQDGTAIPDRQIKEITMAAHEFEQALGPVKDLIEKLDLTIAHTNGKFPFLRSDASGLYSNSDKTITVGMNGIQAFAHELTHAIDDASATMSKHAGKYGMTVQEGAYTVDGKDIAHMAKNMMNGSKYEIDRLLSKSGDLTPSQKLAQQILKARIGKYYNESEEVFARLMEQYVSTKLAGTEMVGSGSTLAEGESYYHEAPGYWSKENFAKMMPDVKKLFDSKMALARQRFAIEVPQKFGGVYQYERPVLNQPFVTPEKTGPNDVSTESIKDTDIGKMFNLGNQAGFIDPGVMVEDIKKVIEDYKKGQADKEFGAAIRTYFVGERDMRIAETNQMVLDFEKKVKTAVEQDALTLMRDFKKRPEELELLLNGTHPYYDAGMQKFNAENPKATEEEKLEFAKQLLERGQELHKIIEQAKNPTEGMKAVDKQMTEYFANRLKEGQDLGFLDSKLSPEEYINHLLQPKDDAEQGKKKQLFPQKNKINRYFANSKSRAYKDVVEAYLNGVEPRTLNALNAMAIYGDKHATVAATRLLINMLKDTDLGKWGARKSEYIPKDWQPIAPESNLFKNEIPFTKETKMEGLSEEEKAKFEDLVNKGFAKVIGESYVQSDIAHQSLFAPAKVAEAIQPITDPSYLNRVPGFMNARMYQAYIKAAELGLSVFHMKAMAITSMNNQGIKNFIDSVRADLNSPAFKMQEQNLIKAGGTTSILGRTIEAYRTTRETSVIGRLELLSKLPGIAQVDAAAKALTHQTFEVLQRKIKVMDFATKDAAWLAKNPNATDIEHFEAQKSIAKELNAAYGGLQWEILGANKLTTELSKIVLLAPDWTFSNFFNAKYAFEGGPAGQAARGFWLRSLITGIIMTELASLLLSGKPSKNPTKVFMGHDNAGKEVYQNMFFVGAPGDLVNLLININDYGLVQGLAQSLGTKTGPLIKTGIQFLTNRNYLGQTIVPKGSGPIEGTMRSAEQLVSGLSPIPFSIQNFFQMLTDQQHQYLPAEYASVILGGTRSQHVVPEGQREVKSGAKKGQLVNDTSGLPQTGTAQMRLPVGITQVMKGIMLEASGNKDKNITHYQLDHKVPLSLGGDNSLSNLQLQPMDKFAPNGIGADTKDKVEKAAVRAVRNGDMKIKDAQSRMANDWKGLGRELGIIN